MAIVRNDEIAPLRVLGDELRLLLRSSSSAYRMSAMTVDVVPGAGVPPHTHSQVEESYFVLDGELTLMLGEHVHRLTVGDFAHILPGEVHGYRNEGKAPARFLAWTVGGPIDEFFLAMSQRVRQMPADAPVMAELMEHYGVEMAAH